MFLENYSFLDPRPQPPSRLLRGFVKLLQDLSQDPRANRVPLSATLRVQARGCSDSGQMIPFYLPFCHSLAWQRQCCKWFLYTSFLSHMCRFGALRLQSNGGMYTMHFTFAFCSAYVLLPPSYVSQPITMSFSCHSFCFLIHDSKRNGVHLHFTYFQVHVLSQSSWSNQSKNVVGPERPIHFFFGPIFLPATKVNTVLTHSFCCT